MNLFLSGNSELRECFFKIIIIIGGITSYDIYVSVYVDTRKNVPYFMLAVFIFLGSGSDKK